MDAPQQKDWTTGRYRKVRAPGPYEHDIQVSILQYFEFMRLPHVKRWEANPHGELRDKKQYTGKDGKTRYYSPSGKKLKKSGVKKGKPDLEFHWNCGTYDRPSPMALYMEVKRPGEKLSEEQRECLMIYASIGYKVGVAEDLEKAISIFELHGLTRPRQAAGRT